MTTQAPPRPQLPDDWREWPVPAKMRLRWRLQTDWSSIRPRPNQLTPGPHVLCMQPVAKCEEALHEVARYPTLDPIERAEFLIEHGHVDWLIWLILTGRGWGKTRVGAEDMADYGRKYPGTRLALIAATFGDVRDTMVEGESGLLQVLHPSELWGGSADRAWNRSIGELLLANGTRMKAFSAEKPNRLRGPQHHRAWCDELAAWENMQDTWDMMMFGLRLVPPVPRGMIAPPPQVVVTTTPKPKKLLLEVRDRISTIVTRGRTLDNAHNLAAPTLAELKRKYGGTRLGRQELEGELIEEVEGALWHRAMIDVDKFRPDIHGDAARTLAVSLVEHCSRVVCAVDPAVTATPDSDETGIIIAGMSRARCPVCSKTAKHRDERHALVMADFSGRMRVEKWASTVARELKRFHGDEVVAEVNNGGDLVESNLMVADGRLPYQSVHAKKGKKLRAQPVAHQYALHRVHHIGTLYDLEDQMCTWDPEEDDDSPDRLDALVYALTDLMVGFPSLGTGTQERQQDER